MPIDRFRLAVGRILGSIASFFVMMICIWVLGYLVVRADMRNRKIESMVAAKNRQNVEIRDMVGELLERQEKIEENLARLMAEWERCRDGLSAR